MGPGEKKATGHALDWGVEDGSEPPRIFLNLYRFGLEILKCTSWKKNQQMGDRDKPVYQC